ncbi:hypothetical protein EG68_08509 [Paragonimus skrjabini miyazakii]|uniref:Uncharacterized protein n=1 Tax=Paragonimus skrjabini miyazakii TaxID=59628 RepID=A0A8S9YSF5_9TREM|nr:hypothetical protein EG68_08509 [Paragonimus skrjabini miyazakii]
MSLVPLLLCLCIHSNSADTDVSRGQNAELTPHARTSFRFLSTLTCFSSLLTNSSVRPTSLD